MEYLVFVAGAVIFGLFLLWCIVDAGLDARTHARNAEAAAETAAATAAPAAHDEVTPATTH